jgi:hypothetical protein
MLTVRWAEPGERPRIQRYLFDNMGKIPFERWHNILDCRWIPEDDRYGAVVMDDGHLCGFLGIVFADRPIAGTTHRTIHRTGNITSWYLQKDMRRSGLGHEMLALVTSPPGVTYVATSPNPRSGGLLAKVGWDVLEERRLVWHRTDATPQAKCAGLSCRMRRANSTPAAAGCSPTTPGSMSPLMTCAGPPAKRAWSSPM